MKDLDQHIQTAQAKIDEAMQRHERAVLAFSGGKDSLACLRLLYPYRDRVTVATVDTGAIFPHMIEFIHEACKEYHLHVIKTDQAEYWSTHGVPSSIVPIYNHPQAGVVQHAHGERLLVNDWVACHEALINTPMAEYVKSSGATLFIMGNRNDEGYAANPKSVYGAELMQPISDWARETVFAYLDSIGVAPPRHYKEGISTSLDCWNCPNETTEHVVRFIKRELPERMKELQYVLYAAYSPTVVALRKELPILREAGVADLLPVRFIESRQ